MAQKSNESIDNDLRYQILKAKMEVYEIQRSFNSLNNKNCYYSEDTILKGILEAAKEAANENEQHQEDKQEQKESLIKEIDENKDIPPMPDIWPWDYLRWKDYCKMNNITNKDVVYVQDNGYVIKDGFGREIKRIPPTDPKVETGYITRDEENGVGYLHYPDGNAQTFKIRDATTKKIEKEAANEQYHEDKQERVDGVNVEKVLSALDQIAKKLISYKYPDAHNILNLKEFITSDRRMIKGTHLNKVYINRTIYSVDMLINDAEDDLDASELMVLYFGIYLARIKNKEIRSVKISRRI
jgi:hypothetical protein